MTTRLPNRGQPDARVAEPPKVTSASAATARAGRSTGTSNAQLARRILIIDDNAAIHDDFRKLLSPGSLTGAAHDTQQTLDETENALFGHAPVKAAHQDAFVIDSALQGRDGLECVRRSLQRDEPYAMAFVDMRMPPGWDGVETVTHLWSVDPNIEVVVCSAYFDYSWNEIMKRLARPDRVRLLLKPFSSKDAIGLAWERTNRWLSRRREEAEAAR